MGSGTNFGRSLVGVAKLGIALGNSVREMTVRSFRNNPLPWAAVNLFVWESGSCFCLKGDQWIEAVGSASDAPVKQKVPIVTCVSHGGELRLTPMRPT